MRTFDKPDHLKYSLETFSEQDIEQLLEAGSNFRSLRPAHRDKLLSDMRLGRWEPGTGQPLIFDDKGKLLDGQHRLDAALIFQRENEGKRLWFSCIRGAAPSIAKNIDTGLNRCLADYLQREGAPYVQFCSAIVAAEARHQLVPKGYSNTLAHVAHGRLAVRVKAGEGKGPKSGVALKPSLGHAIDVWKRNRARIEEWTHVAESVHKANLPRPGLMGALGYQFGKQDNTLAKLFYDALVTGTELKSNDPIYVLRERLIADKNSASKLAGEHFAAIVIKAWVAWNEDRSLTKLLYRQFGPNAEEFPSHIFQKPTASAR